MTRIQLKHKQISSLQLKGNIYEIEISIKKSFLEEIDSYYFLLKGRNEDNGSDSILNEKKIDTINDLVIFNVEVQVDYMFNKSKLENEIFDFYFVRVKDNEHKMTRIRSDKDNYRFLSVVFEEHKKVFYPYATNKRNISFRFNDYKLFAKLDDIRISKSGTLSFTGMFNYPPLYQLDEYQYKNIKLIVRNNIDESEQVLPLKNFQRTVINAVDNDKYSDSGFKGEFDPRPYIENENKVSFKFYLDLDFSILGENKTVRSIRIKCDSDLEVPKHVIVKEQGERKKYIIKKTKKNSFLSFSIASYDFRKEIMNNLSSNWVKLRRSKQALKIYKTIFNIFKYLPTDDKLIMFESFLGKQYSDNPRAVYEYMSGKYPEYKMYWSADRRSIKKFKGKDIKYIRRFSLSWLIKMSRAKYWITNSRLPLWIPKPPKTIYLQTWHGTPLKRLAADMDEVHMPGTNSVKYKRNFLKEASKWDYLVSPNRYSSEIFKRAFQFDKTMIESGYPRNDFLINNNNESTIKELKKRNNLPLDKKILLYAPTWRDNQFYAKGKYKFNLQLDLDKIKEQLGEEYIIILRMHYLVAENLDLSSYEGFVFDFSNHEDIRELYLISDMLITDYSSVFFDYANLMRPMLFFVYDIDNYRDNLRGFYFDFEEKAPGPLTKSTDEIIDVIRNIDQVGYEPNIVTKEFYNKFCYLEDGNASKKVVEEVFGKTRV